LRGLPRPCQARAAAGASKSADRQDSL